MRVYGYTRVSTQEQAKEGYSIGAQSGRLEAYCKARNWTLCKIYSDPGVSGAKLERPGLQMLISDIKQDKADLVLVYKLDRLSRSQKDTLYLIEDVFMKNDVAFLSINENFDTSTAFGRAMVGILSVFAQLEREQIKERTQMGRVERAKEGLWKGGGIVPVGYQYVEATNELRVDDYEAMQVREAFDLYVNSGYSLTRVAKEMHARGYRYKSGSWSSTKTVKYVLSNPIYIGKIVWEGETYAGKHQPIISDDLFAKAQKRLSDTSWKDNLPPEFSPFAATQLLTGLLFCKRCGARYYGAGAYRGSKKLPYKERNYIHIYTCYSVSKTKKDMIKDPNCKNKRWRADLLDFRVTEQIKRLYTDPVYFDNLVVASPHTEDKRSAILHHIAELDQQMERMLDLYQFKNFPTEQIGARLEALSKEKADMEAMLEPIKQNEPALSIEQARALIVNAQDVIETGTISERRTLIHSLIKRIDIDGDDIYITWRFL